LKLTGATSGTATITAQATANTPTLTLPNASGTFAISASAPIVLSATTGNLTAPTAVTSASALTANQLVVGGGGQASAALGSLGTTTTLLHGNAGGAPSFSAIAGADLSLTINAQTGTSYAFQDSDRGNIVTFANATAATIVAATIAQAGAAGAFASGWYCYFSNLGTNTVTLTPTTSTIGGYNVLVIPPGASGIIFSDATNFKLLTIGGRVQTSGDASMLSCGQLNPILANTRLANNNWATVSGANVVRAFYMNLSMNVGITKATLFRGTTTASGKITVTGIYDNQKNKLFQTTSFDMGTGGVQTLTLSTTYLLLSGSYYWAVAPDATTVFSDLVHGTAVDQGTFWSAGTAVRWGTAANAMSAGTLPAALGAITTITTQTVPAVLFEPV
jgi:hypothetical protein